MRDQAKKAITSTARARSRRLLRTTWAGTVATITACGLLFSTAVNVLDPPSRDNGRDRLLQATRPVHQVTAARARTVPENVRPDQIVTLLERAEQRSRAQSPGFSSTVAQAAAELGMLYTTYTMQQRAVRERRTGLRIQDAPVVHHPRNHTDRIDVGTTNGIEPVAEGSTSSRDAPTAVQASYKQASATEFEVDPAEPAEHVGHVTYDQIVIAAVRLANLLDRQAAAIEVSVQREALSPRQISAPTEARGARTVPGFPLEERLRDAVTMFAGSTLGYANGRIPTTALCPLDFAPGHLLRCDAAQRLTALSNAFRDEFGYPIPVTDSYRSYGAQVSVARAKPHLAAIPGTSNHGWGLAVDLSNPISGGRSAEYVWLRIHGPSYGWDNPSWARPDGSKPEPWHFEFFSAGPVPDRAINQPDVGAWSSTGARDDKKGGKEAAGPHREAAIGAPSKSRPSDDRADTPARRSGDEPSGPPSQKPSKPTTKPTTKPTPESRPSAPAPKPTTRPTKPIPAPSPTASTPIPEPSAAPVPAPSPSPSEEPSAAPSPAHSRPAPSPTPTPTSDRSETPPTPTSSSSSPASHRPLSGVVKGLTLTTDRTADRLNGYSE